MRVFLAPFLHGSRYTSFGRHFTHPDKLREVVERLHPYIDDGDVVRTGLQVGYVWIFVRS